MRVRRRRALGRSVALLGSLVLLAGALVTAAPAQGLSDAERTLVVSLPGPFTGCGYLDAGTSPTSRAIGDLLLPSAFYTRPDGSLAGVGGPIASAELVSLSPQTVVYTVAAKQRWSDGRPFTAADLVAWWQRARSLPSVDSDGYRAISSMTLSSDSLSVTALFSHPDSYWNQLFRDVEAPGGPTGCAIENLLRRPSLGPYLVSAASAGRIVLTMNRHWLGDSGRYGRLVLVSDAPVPSAAGTLFAGYSTSVTAATLQLLSGRPWVSSHLGSVSSIEELAFSPLTQTRRILVREALSWMIGRQDLINRVFGAVTFSPSVAASVLFSQGQIGYPGGAGSGPGGQSETPTSTTSLRPGAPVSIADCPACVVPTLKSAGLRLLGGHWVGAGGQALSVRLVSGPLALDRNSANLVAGDLRRGGVSVTMTTAPTDLAAARAVGSGRADLAVFARPTGSAPTDAARSFTGPPYPDSYSSGLSLPFAGVLYERALATFNPVSAAGAWREMDKLLLQSYWVRPLFTPPSLVTWNNLVGGVNGSLSVPGFVDQITGWSTVPAASTGQ